MSASDTSREQGGAMAKGRMDDHPFEPVRAPAECVDCDAEFTATLYTGDTVSDAFIRDHPQNGCHVKVQRAIATTIERTTENER